MIALLTQAIRPVSASAWVSLQSCFLEIADDSAATDHVRIIATVNVNSETVSQLPGTICWLTKRPCLQSRAKMKSWFEKWQAERKRRKDTGEPAMIPYRDIQ